MGRWIDGEAGETEGTTRSERASTADLKHRLAPPPRREAAPRHLPIGRADKEEKSDPDIQQLARPGRAGGISV
jgi:hypothetical protein